MNESIYQLAAPYKQLNLELWESVSEKAPTGS